MMVSTGVPQNIHCAEPWLSYIESGTKTYEGRVLKKVWKTVKVGDHLCLFDESKEVK